MPVDILADRPINPDEGIPKPQIDVTARPVETYVKPVSASASALGQLAGSLKSLNPALGQIEEKFKQQAEVQGETAAATAFAKEKGNWDKAVQNGDIPSILNPFARMKAREVFGRLAGDKLATDIAADPQYVQDSANATTMEQHDTAWSNARQRWEAANLGHNSHSDPLFQNSFQTMAAGHEKDARVKAAGEIEHNFVTLNGKHLGDEIANHIDAMMNEGGSLEDIQRDVTNLANDPTLPELVRRGALITALDAIARKRNDSTVFDLADGIKIRGYNGKDYNLSTDIDFQDDRDKVRYALAHTDQIETRDFNSKVTQRQAAVRASVASDLIDALAKNSSTQLDLSSYRAAYQDAGMGNKVGEINKLVEAIRKGEPSGPGHLADLMANIKDRTIRSTNDAYVTTAKLVKALREGQISTADYRTLQTMVDKRDKERGGGGTEHAENFDHVFDRWLNQTKLSFDPATIKSNLPGFGGDIQGAQNQAMYELSRDYEDFRNKHPDASSHEVEKFLAEDLASLRKYYLAEGLMPGSKAAIQPPPQPPRQIPGKQ
jgi:hypothetical protein